MNIKKTIWFIWVVLIFPFNYCRAFFRIFIYTIKAIRRSPIFILDLSDLNLLWIPQIIIFYPAREIRLSGNYLTFLPLGFSLLKKDLLSLELCDNHFQKIPSVLYKFTTLNNLDLSGNHIKMIPPEINRLKNLKRFFIAQNKLEVIDTAIGDLPQLLRLGLHYNPNLSTIPESIGQLIHLKQLFLEGTNLITLPVSLKKLKMATQADFILPHQLHTIPTGWQSFKHKPRFSSPDGLSIDYEKFGLPKTIENFRTDRVFDYIFATPKERVEIIKEHLNDEMTTENKFNTF